MHNYQVSFVSLKLWCLNLLSTIFQSFVIVTGLEGGNGRPQASPRTGTIGGWFHLKWGTRLESIGLGTRWN